MRPTSASAIRLCSRRRTVGGEISAATSRKSSWWKRQLPASVGANTRSSCQLLEQFVDFGLVQVDHRGQQRTIEAAADQRGRLDDRKRVLPGSQSREKGFVEGVGHLGGLAGIQWLLLELCDHLFDVKRNAVTTLVYFAARLAVELRVQREDELVGIRIAERTHLEHRGGVGQRGSVRPVITTISRPLLSRSSVWTTSTVS